MSIMTRNRSGSRLILSCLFLFLSLPSIGSTAGVTQVWARRLGGSGADYSRGIAADPSGNVYLTGEFSGAADFAADFGLTDLKTSAGGYDIFVARISAGGSYGWTRRIGAASNDFAGGVATDPAGNLYLVGSFQGTVDFAADSGATDSRTAAGSADAFITRINADGSYAWTRRIGGPGVEYGNAVAARADGVCLAGSFQASADFAADCGTTDLKTAAGTSDAFITCLGADGSYRFTRRIGGAGADYGRGITLGPDGAVYLAGYFETAMDPASDFGAADSKTTAGGSDVFITRIEPDGAYGWTRRIGGPGPDYARGIAADLDGVLVTGRFVGEADFAADFGGDDLIFAAGSDDTFLTRITADGGYDWTSRMGGYGVAVDHDGNAYAAGIFSGAVNFGADFGRSDVKVSAGGADVALSRLNPRGGYNWTRRMGGMTADVGNCVTTGPGAVFIAGYFTDTVDFAADFGGRDVKTAAGASDVFIASIVSPAGEDVTGGGSAGNHDSGGCVLSSSASGGGAAFGFIVPAALALAWRVTRRRRQNKVGPAG